MEWASFAVSLVALGVSIWAIVEARKAGSYTIKKEAAEKRATLLKLVGQMDRKLQEGIAYAKQLERFCKDNMQFVQLQQSLVTYLNDLQTAKADIKKAPTAVELSEIEIHLNNIEPRAGFITGFDRNCEVVSYSFATA